MRGISIAMLVLAAAAGVAACAPTETGNGADAPTTVTLSLGLTASELDSVGAPVVRDADGVPFSVAQAAVSVRRIDLWLPEGETCEQRRQQGGPGTGWLGCQAGDDRLRLDGPWILDLTTGTWDPPLAAVAVPPGVYRRISFDLDEADPAEGLVAPGGALDGRTFALDGTFVPGGGAATAFRMRLAFSEEVRFEPVGDAPFTFDMAHTVVLSMDVSAWFAAAPLAQCAQDGEFATIDGVVEIEDAGGECSEVEGAIKDAIAGSGELEEAEPADATTTTEAAAYGEGPAAGAGDEAPNETEPAASDAQAAPEEAADALPEAAPPEAPEPQVPAGDEEPAATPAAEPAGAE